MSQSANSRRPAGKCRRGLHDWIEPNIYRHNGREFCAKCRAMTKRRANDKRRKSPIVEPDVYTVPASTWPAGDRPRVERGFWDRQMATLQLLGPDEVLVVEFPFSSEYQPSDSQISWAAKRAGVRVATLWQLDGRVFLRRVGRAGGRAA